MTRPFAQNRIIVRGAGDLASGVIRSLSLAGFEVMALEKPNPDCVRRYVCFAEAFYEQKVSVEGVTAVLVDSAEDAIAIADKLHIPLLIDPQAKLLPDLAPMAIIDARMLKKGIDARLDMAPIAIGLGPGFIVGENCTAAIETKRGTDLGRVIYDGSPVADTGIPASVNGFGFQRVLRSPADGKFVSVCQITDLVKRGQIIGEVAGITVAAEIDGIVRGLIHDGLEISLGQKIGDIDPRARKEYCYKISDKANAVGTGVLEAIRALRGAITC